MINRILLVRPSDSGETFARVYSSVNPPPFANYPEAMPLPRGDQQLIQIMDASWADAARRAGPHLACRIGCTQCCHGAFAINALDAARLRAGMDELRSTDPIRAAAIERRAIAWISEHG